MPDAQQASPRPKWQWVWNKDKHQSHQPPFTWTQIVDIACSKGPAVFIDSGRRDIYGRGQSVPYAGWTSLSHEKEPFDRLGEFLFCVEGNHLNYGYEKRRYYPYPKRDAVSKVFWDPKDRTERLAVRRGDGEYNINPHRDSEAYRRALYVLFQNRGEFKHDHVAERIEREYDRVKD